MLLPAGPRRMTAWRGSGAGTPSAPIWSRGAKFQSVRHNAKSRLATTDGTPAVRLRESAHLGEDGTRSRSAVRMADRVVLVQLRRFLSVIGAVGAPLIVKMRR